MTLRRQSVCRGFLERVLITLTYQCHCPAWPGNPVSAAGGYWIARSRLRQVFSRAMTAQRMSKEMLQRAKRRCRSALVEPRRRLLHGPIVGNMFMSELQNRNW